MKINYSFALLALLLPPLGMAEPPPKTVILGGQTQPIDIQVMPDVVMPVMLTPGTVVTTQPVAVAPAKPRRLYISGSSTAGNPPEPLTVTRDSILKFVNMTITSASDSNDDGFMQCAAWVDAHLGGYQEQPIRLGYIQLLDETGESGQGNGVVEHASGYQFLTGDLLVQANSVLTLSVVGASGSCSVAAYGILFEQE
jgi:hypothetical protein